MSDQDIIDIWEAVRKQERFKSPFWEQIANETIVSLLAFVQKGGKQTNLEHLALKMAKHHRHRIGQREARYIPVTPDVQGDMVWTPLDKLPERATTMTPERFAMVGEVLDTTTPGWRKEGLKELNDAPEGKELSKTIEKHQMRIRRFLGR